MQDFVKATIVGGLLFLLPVILILFFLGFAVRSVAEVLQPVLDGFQLDRLEGIVVVALAVLVLVFVSFLAGIIARTELGGRITSWLETSLLGDIPQYQLVKSMAQGLAHIEGSRDVKPALVSIQGGWQIGYLLETLENGWVTVFLPQAPRATLGNVMYFAADRVRPLDMTVGEAMAIVTSVGIGSGEALRGADMTPPKGGQ